MAAGAQITHSRREEVVTRNNETVLYEAGHRNGYNLNPLTSIYERASLVPAAAVIPALKMHRHIAAVKKLVVGSVPARRSTQPGAHWWRGLRAGLRSWSNLRLWPASLL